MPRKIRKTCSLTAAICFLILSGTPDRARAQQIDRNVLKQFDIGPARLSTDTSPVKIRVGFIVYDIPRNYMEYPDQLGPVLKITYPGYKPFSEETRACFEQKPMSNGPTACRTILHGSTGPGPGGRALNNDEMFENFKKNTPGLAPPEHDAFGYDIR